MITSTYTRHSAIAAGALLLALPLHAQAGAAGAAARYRESYTLEANGDYIGAQAKVAEARRMGAGDAYFAALRLGWLAYRAGDYFTAAARYGDAATLAPAAIEPKVGLTLPLLAAKDWRGLERACRAVLAIDAQHAVAQARLAIALYQQGRWRETEQVYRTLVAQWPADLDYRTGLGWALLRQGKTAEARTLFANVLAVSPDNVNAAAGLAAH